MGQVPMNLQLALTAMVTVRRATFWLAAQTAPVT